MDYDIKYYIALIDNVSVAENDINNFPFNLVGISLSFSYTNEFYYTMFYILFLNCPRIL